MHSIDNKESVALWAAALGSSYVLYKAIKVYQATPSATQTLRGPESPSWFGGNNEVARAPFTDGKIESWIQEYGATFATYTFFGAKEVLTADTQAMAFILNHQFEFPKGRFLTKELFGEGLLAVEGFQHKKQRKVLNPAFGGTAMRDMTPMFLEIAQELRDAWKKKMSESVATPGFQEINVLDWLTSASIDMIGLAGFGSRFNCLHDSANELAGTFRDLSHNLSLIKGMGMLIPFFPFLRHLPIGSNVTRNRGREVMRRAATRMVEEKKAEAELLGKESLVGGKDLLSLLVRANLQEDEAERLDDETLSAQIGTFLLAGHETTAMAAAWGLHALAKSPSVQAKLQHEVRAFTRDSPSMEELNSLSYLGNVVKEILRLKAPIASINRHVRSDIIIPLAQPVVNKRGTEVHEIL
ncbi:hypothetical protein FRB97_001596 [Tulasnella sp. 331]|nr:hypothetical protein FRB97_001596 [Tulasnella sp. 331]